MAGGPTFPQRLAPPCVCDSHGPQLNTVETHSAPPGALALRKTLTSHQHRLFPPFIPFYFKLAFNEVNTFLVGAPFNVGGAPQGRVALLAALTSWKEEKNQGLKVISVAGVMTRRRLVNGLRLKRD